MSEKWWENKEERANVLELFSKEDFKEIASDAFDFQDTGLFKKEHFLDVLPPYMRERFDRVRRVTTAYMRLSIVQSLLGPEMSRYSKTYARCVVSFANGMEALGIKTSEEVKEALPEFRRVATFCILSDPDAIRDMRNQCADEIKPEMSQIELQEDLGINKDYVDIMLENNT